jgi:radical SAM superfamily enzyme YgiQ (UPF0313 family)
MGENRAQRLGQEETAMNVLLVSTYDLGHQPFGLASVAAWLRQQGASVSMIDLAVQRLDEDAVSGARLIAVHLPMHTATRLALPIIAHCRAVNRNAHICCFGLYAPMNNEYLRSEGANSIIGGEFETAIVQLYQGLSAEGAQAQNSDLRAPAYVDLRKQNFLAPDRRGLPALDRYSKVVMRDGTQRVAGYTEASRGCKHLCRHCPIVPVYQGRFRAIQRGVVLADISQQVTDGAKHISFGDPDFFNGVGHAIRLVTEMHEAFPDLTYDVTIKVEHLLRHSDHLQTLVETGCLFITTAVEAVDDHILRVLDKRHTRADFIAVVNLTRELGIELAPTFVPFTPWATAEGYIDLLETIHRLDLVGSVAPIQLAIRLLLPAGSYLMQLEETKRHVTGFDGAGLAYQWHHPDPIMDRLQKEVQQVVQSGENTNRARSALFEDIWMLSHAMTKKTAPPLMNARCCDISVPHMTEQWYCCAEPTENQLNRI